MPLNIAVDNDSLLRLNFRFSKELNVQVNIYNNCKCISNSPYGYIFNHTLYIVPFPPPPQILMNVKLSLVPVMEANVRTLLEAFTVPAPVAM